MDGGKVGSRRMDAMGSNGRMDGVGSNRTRKAGRGVDHRYVCYPSAATATPATTTLTIDVYIQLFAVPHTSERRPRGAAWEYSQATPTYFSHTQRGMCGEGRHGLEHRSGLGVFAGQT